MKVLFHAYNTCCQTESGGVQVRMKKIKSLLENRGVTVDFFNPYTTNLRDYDVLHIFMLTPETYALMDSAKTLGLKVVLSSIVNLETCGKHIFINHKLSPIYRRLGFSTTDNLKYGAIHKCDVIIAETPAEKQLIAKYYHVNADLIRVIPNGVEELTYHGDEIFDLIGKRCNYVMQVGRVDKNKNLLNVIRAIKGTDIDLVVVGGKYARGDMGYYDSCLKEADGCSNIHFLGWLPSGSKEIASAYSNAHALIMPSYSETFGLTATEAAVSGCHVCLSNTLPILAFNVFDKTLSFNPSSISEIRKVLEDVMKLDKNDLVKTKALSVFSWDAIIDSHIDVYKK